MSDKYWSIIHKQARFSQEHTSNTCPKVDLSTLLGYKIDHYAVFLYTTHYRKIKEGLMTHLKRLLSQQQSIFERANTISNYSLKLVRRDGFLFTNPCNDKITMLKSAHISI
jgi:hypothetical protein